MGLWRVAKEGDIQDGGRVCLELEGRTLTLLRHGAQYHCIDAFCYHLGGPLGAEGDIENLGTADPTIRCPWHHHKISLTTGKCVSVGGGCPVAHPAKKQRVHSVIVDEGRIWVNVQDGQPPVLSDKYNARHLPSYAPPGSPLHPNVFFPTSYQQAIDLSSPYRTGTNLASQESAQSFYSAGNGTGSLHPNSDADAIDEDDSPRPSVAFLEPFAGFNKFAPLTSPLKSEPGTGALPLLAATYLDSPSPLHHPSAAHFPSAPPPAHSHSHSHSHSHARRGNLFGGGAPALPSTSGSSFGLPGSQGLPGPGTYRPSARNRAAIEALARNPLRVPVASPSLMNGSPVGISSADATLQSLGAGAGQKRTARDAQLTSPSKVHDGMRDHAHLTHRGTGVQGFGSESQGLHGAWGVAGDGSAAAWGPSMHMRDHQDQRQDGMQAEGDGTSDGSLVQQAQVQASAQAQWTQAQLSLSLDESPHAKASLMSRFAQGPVPGSLSSS